MPDPHFSFLSASLIFLGAGVGGVARYALSGAVQGLCGPTFPLGTLVVNVSGCLAIGFLAELWTGPVLIRDAYRSAVLIGLIGGYTTFSSFGRETLALLHDGQWWRAAAYIFASVFLSLLAVWAGSAACQKLYGSGAI